MIDLNRIHIGMEVRTSDGQRLGTVKQLLGQVMFLDDVDPAPRPGDLSVPLIWITGVNTAVELAKSREQVEKEWRPDAGPAL